MDVQKAFDAGFDAVKRYVDGITDQVEERLIALEKRAPEPAAPGERGPAGEAGRDGIGLADIVRDAAGDLIAVMSDGRTKSIGNIAVRDGVDGKNGVDGKDGADGKDGLPGTDGKNGRDGIDGKDVDIDALRSAINEAVARSVAEAMSNIRLPVDGKDGRDGVDGRDGIDGRDGKDGVNGKDGSDGIGLAAAIQDADGNLIVTDTKGGAHNVGRVRGVNGADGRDGKDGADGLSGKDGPNGRDGFGFDDMDLVETDEGFVLRFSREGVAKDFRIPVPVDRGTFKDGQSYRKGDGVSFGGSFWIAQEDTADKPETGKGWRLAVKRGRDGRDGAPGERGPEGKSGPAGRDLTQLGADGSKW